MRRYVLLRCAVGSVVMLGSSFLAMVAAWGGGMAEACRRIKGVACLAPLGHSWWFFGGPALALVGLGLLLSAVWDAGRTERKP